MPISATLKEKEKKIMKELKSLGLGVVFRIDKVDPKTSAWEHTVGFLEVPSPERATKVWEVVNKHYNQWLKESKQ